MADNEEENNIAIKTITRNSIRRRLSGANGKKFPFPQLLTLAITILLALNLCQLGSVSSGQLGAQALKLQSLFSWMHPRQQEVSQQQDSQQQHQHSALILSGSPIKYLGDNLDPMFASASTNNQPEPALRHQPTSGLRSFQSVLMSPGKHGPQIPFFSSLPKSLFGRFLSSGPVSVGNTPRVVLPSVKQQQQQLWVRPQEERRPSLAGFATYPQLDLRAVSFSSGQQRLPPVKMVQPQLQHFNQNRPHPQQSIMEEPRKHALGYGESDDFQIMEGPGQPEEQQQQQEHEGPHAEMPAILITDNEDQNQSISGGGNSTGADNSFDQTSSSLRQPMNETFSATNEKQTMASNLTESDFSGQQIQSKPSTGPIEELQVAAASSNGSKPIGSSGDEEINNSTAGDGNILTSLISEELLKLKSEPEMLNKTFNSMRQPLASLFMESTRSSPTESSNETFSVESSDNLSGQAEHQVAIDNPEKGGQESSAGPSFVPLPGLELTSNSKHNDISQQHADEQLESFIIGPYKGLTSDNLAPNFNHHQQGHYGQQLATESVSQYLTDRPHRLQQKPTVGFGMTSMASNLLQQAKSLIQLPFVHMAHHQQQQSSSFYPSSPNSAMPMKQSNFQGQQHLEQMMEQSSSPSPLYNNPMPSVPREVYRPSEMVQQQPSYQQAGRYGKLPSKNRYFVMMQHQHPTTNNFYQPQHQQQQQFSATNFFPNEPMGGQLAYQESLRNILQQSPALDSSRFMKPEKSHPINNLAFEKNQQRQQQIQQPAYGYNLVVDHKNKQPALGNAQVQPTMATSGSLAENQLRGLGDKMANGNQREIGKFRSGLYQIEPPKLEASKAVKSLGSQQVSGFATADQQQQKIVADEQSEDLPANSLEQQIKEEAAEANEPEDEDEASDEREPDQQQQVDGLKKPDVEGKFSAKQVGASIGFSGAQTKPQVSAASTKGQVFSEPISNVMQSISSDQPQGDGRSVNHMKSLKMTQDVTLYNLEVPAGGEQPEQSLQKAQVGAATVNPMKQQQQHMGLTGNSGVGLLETQVYTVPYTVSMETNGNTFFTPERTNQQFYNQNRQQHFRNMPPQSPQPMSFQHQSPRLPLQAAQDGNIFKPYFPQAQMQRPSTFYDWSSAAAQQMSVPTISIEPVPAQTPTRQSNMLDLQQHQQQHHHHHQPIIPTNNHYFHYQPVQQQQQQQQEKNEVAPIYDGVDGNQRQPGQYQQFMLAIQHDPNNVMSDTRGGASIFAQQNSFATQNQQPHVLAKYTQAQPSVSNIQQQNNALPTEPTRQQQQIAETPQPEVANSATMERQQQTTISSIVQQVNSDESASEEPREVGEQASSSPSSIQVVSAQVPSSPSAFCAGREAGLYADESQRCKAYYQCAPTGHQMFRCNNQTQFNQKTQNCDWWYNVNCGGRLGSPSDFEQAIMISSTIAPATKDQQDRSDVLTSNQPLVVREQESESIDMFHHSESHANTTIAPVEVQTERVRQQIDMPTSTQAYNSIQRDRQQQQEQQEFSERSSTTQDPLLLLSSTTDSLQQPVELTGGNNNSPQQQPEAQPQVGANPNFEENASTTQSNGDNSSTGEPPAAITIAAAAPTTTTTITTTAIPTTTEISSSSQTSQTSETNRQGENESGAFNKTSDTEGENSVRRLIQSEFGRGAMRGEANRKSARSSSARYSLLWSRQPISGQLHPNHKYANDSAAPESPIYSAGANQGSISYMPMDEAIRYLTAKGVEEEHQQQQQEIPRNRKEADESPITTTSTASPGKPDGAKRVERRYGTRLINQTRKVPVASR